MLTQPFGIVHSNRMKEPFGIPQDVRARHTGRLLETDSLERKHEGTVIAVVPLEFQLTLVVAEENVKQGPSVRAARPHSELTRAFPDGIDVVKRIDLVGRVGVVAIIEDDTGLVRAMRRIVAIGLEGDGARAGWRSPRGRLRAFPRADDAAAKSSKLLLLPRPAVARCANARSVCTVVAAHLSAHLPGRAHASDALPRNASRKAPIAT